MRYMAPEVALRGRYNEKVDIYSFGVILYELVTGVTPFKYNKQDFIDNVVIKNFRPALDVDEYGRTIRVGEPVVKLIKSCWDPTYSKRPTASEALRILTSYREEVMSKSACGSSVKDYFFSRNY